MINGGVCQFFSTTDLKPCFNSPTVLGPYAFGQNDSFEVLESACVPFRADEVQQHGQSTIAIQYPAIEEHNSWLELLFRQYVASQVFEWSTVPLSPGIFASQHRANGLFPLVISGIDVGSRVVGLQLYHFVGTSPFLAF